MYAVVKATPQIINLPIFKNFKGQACNAQYLHGYIIIDENGIPYREENEVIPSWKTKSAAQMQAAWLNR